jgi:hypothetical protein
VVPAALHSSWRAFTVQHASSGVWWMVMSASIVSFTKAMMSAAGIQGAPSRAVMSDGRRSAGWTRLSASTLRK